MSDSGSQLSVAEAQRRLLESVASYGNQHDAEGQATLALVFADALLDAAVAAGWESPREGEIYVGLASLVAAVHRERAELAGLIDLVGGGDRG